MIIGVDARLLEWQRGGLARYLLNMLILLPKLSDDHQYILYFQNYIPDDDFLNNPIFEKKLIKGLNLLKKHRIVAEQLLMPKQLEKDNLDIFYATCYTAPLRLKGIKTVVAAWDISFSTHPSHFSVLNRISLGYFSRRSCNKASGVITCSDYDASQIEKYYQIPKKKICTLYLAADERFTPVRENKAIQELRNKYKLPKKFILSLGVIYNRRNVDLIINAFKNIKDKFPEFGLVVIGRNNTEPKINVEGLMQPLIQKGRGAYLNWFDDEDLVNLYKAAHYYICTSTVDGETIMLKEAMKAGTPVISSSLLEGTIGGNGRIIKNPESVSEIEKVLSIAMGEDEGRDELIQNGIEWNKQFSWECVARDTLSFLESR